MKRFATYFSFLLIAATASTAFAAPINYLGTRIGDTVEYLNISEDSGTDIGPLFEQRLTGPTVTGDTLQFQPTAAFSSESPMDSQVADTTDGLLTYTVRAKQGYYLDEVTILESGDYSLLAVDGATAAAHVSGFMFDFNNPAHTATLSVHAAGDVGSLSPFDITAPLSDTASDSDGWVGSATLDFSEMQLTEVTIRLDNTLQTAVTEGAGAFIAKKQFAVTTTTTVIPEPASLALFGAGAMLTLVRTRRRG